MKHFNFFRKYYSFYVNLRFFSPPKAYIKWMIVIFNFFAILFHSLNSRLPNDFFTGINDNPTWKTFYYVIYLIPWIFRTTTLLFDGIIFLTTHLIFSILLEIVVRKSNRKKKVYFLEYFLVLVYQCIFIPVSFYALAFRFSHLVWYINNNVSDYKVYISFIISIINIIFSTYHSFLTSVFIDPTDFIIISSVDIYDGKTNMIVFFTRLYFCIIMNLLSWLTESILSHLYVVIMIAMCILLVYTRSINVIHVSFIGNFLEISPFLVSPFVLAIRVHFGDSFLYSLITIVIVLILYSYLSIFQRRVLIKHTYQLFSPFCRKENADANELFTSSIIPRNTASLLRFVASYMCDPNVFDQYLHIQKRFGIRASQLIEVVRFLALFPNKRSELINELNQVSSNSNYHRYTIFLFKKMLKGLVIGAKESHTQHYYEFYRNYVISNHFFWNNVSEKNRIKSFFYSITSLFCNVELFHSIHYLNNRFPLDNNIKDLLKSYELLSIGRIDRKIHIQYEKPSSNRIFDDPIYHSRALIHPHILEYSNEDEISHSFSSTTEISSGYYQPSTSFYALFSDKRLEGSKLSSSYSLKSPIPCYIPSIFSLSFLISLFLIFSYSYYSNRFYVNISNMYQEIPQSLRMFITPFYKLCSSLLTPFASSYNVEFFDNSNITQCERLRMQTGSRIVSYFEKISQLNQTSPYFITHIYNSITNGYIGMNNSCSFLSSIFAVPAPIFDTDQFSNCLSYFDDSISKTESLLNDEQKTKVFIQAGLYVFAIYCVLVVIYIVFLLFFFTKNIPANIVYHLGSKERLFLLLTEKIMESWNLSINKEIQYSFSQQEYRICEINPIDESSILNQSHNIRIMFPNSSLSFKSNRQIDALSFFPIKSLFKDGDDVSLESNTFFDTVTQFTRKEIRKYFWFILIFLSIPWLAYFLFIGVSSIPLRDNRELEILKLLNLKKNQTQMHSFLDLFKFLSIYAYGFQNESVRIIINTTHYDIKKNNLSKLTELYNKITCVSDGVCYSISSLIEEFLASPGTTEADLSMRIIPSIIIFLADSCVSILYPEILNQSNPLTNDGSVLIVIIFVIYITILICTGYADSLYNRGYSNLFVFPNQNSVKSYPIEVENKNANLPTSVFAISTISETNLIYSFSDNASQILKYSTSELIGLRVDEVFNPIKVNEKSLLSFSPMEKRNKRVFQYSVSNRGIVNIYLLYEEELLAQNVMKDKMLAQKLSYCIPHYFAKKIANEGIHCYCFIDTTIVCLRAININRTLVDKYFLILNNLLTNYSQSSLVRIQGEFSTIVFESTCKINTIFMFLRDLIIESKDTLESVLIDYGNINSSICIVQEPYIHHESESIDFLNSVLPRLPSRKVTFSERISDKNASVLCGLDLFSLNEKVFCTIDLDLFISRFFPDT